MPTLTQLQYIVAVDDHRHFGLAAKAQNVSQPSLSQQIQKAEEELDLIIFDRTAKPIRVTEIGLKVIQQARLILAEHQHLKDMALEKKGTLSGHLNIGVIPTLSPYLVPLFLDHFAQKHPQVSLEISELQTSMIIKQLHEEKLDAGLLATPLNENGLHEEPLFYEPFFVYHSLRHPLIKKGPVKLQDLKNLKAWVLSDGHCFGHQMKSYCSLSSENRVLDNIQFQSGSFETLQGLVDGSESYTLFPELFIYKLPDHVKKKQVKPFVAPSPSREVSLVYKRKVWKQDLFTALTAEILDKLPLGLQKPQKKKVLEVGPI